MDTASLYRATRDRLLVVAGDLSEEELTRPVAALPGWTVLDTYAHLTGVCADMLDGRLEGAGSPPWTAVQVAARAGRSLAEVAAEWADRGPDLDRLLAEGDSARTGFVGFDVWTHEQDIRSTVGLGCGRDDDRVRFLGARGLEIFGPRFDSEGTAPLLVVTEQGESVLGTGAPAVTLRISSYEFLRTVFGRRSRSQIEAAGWEGDPSPFIDRLSLFDLPETDLPD